MKRPTVLLPVIDGLATAGCVSSKYQMNDVGPAPAVLLNLPGTSAPLETFVDTVVVYHGPGSWKREAYWDEYVLSLANRGPGRLTLLSAALIDGAGVTVIPGSNWEKLESESRQWWDTNVLAQNLALGAGGLFVGVGMAAAPVGMFLAYAALNGVALTPVGAAFIAVPVAAGLLSGTNENHAKKITAEFSQRRLEMPADLSTNQSIHGSLFFRLTPSPRKLVLTYREAGQLQEVTVDLAILGDLHRKPGTPPAPPVVGETLAPLADLHVSKTPADSATASVPAASPAQL